MPSPRSRASTSCWSARPIFRSSWGCHSTTSATSISERSIKSRRPPRSTASPPGCISSRPGWTRTSTSRRGSSSSPCRGVPGRGRDPERPVRDQALTTVVRRKVQRGVLPGSTRQDRRSISGAGWLLQGPQRLISALRFDDNGANLAASLNGLMRRGRFVKREARSHRQDAPRHRGPRGDVGLRPLPVGVRHACQ